MGMIVRKEKILTGRVVKVELETDRSRGEDSSMQKLGRMLDGRSGGKGARVTVRGADDAHDINISWPEDLVAEGGKKSPKTAEEDRRLQRQVIYLLEEANTSITETNFQFHIEHVIMIKLGKLSQTGALTFESYTNTKNKHHQQIKERLRNNEIKSYDFDTDVYGRIDKRMNVHMGKSVRFGSKDRLSKKDKDKLIQSQVDALLVEEHEAVSEKDLQYHIEHILLIKLGKMVNDDTLTYDKYNRMKSRHREEIRAKLKRKEIITYVFETDVYGRIDAAIDADMRKNQERLERQRAEQLLPAHLDTVKEEEEVSPVVLELKTPTIEIRPPEVAKKPTKKLSKEDTHEGVSFVVHLNKMRAEKKVTFSEKDDIVQRNVAVFLDDTKPPFNPKKLQHHLEHVVMIKLGNLLEGDGLTFQAYDAEKEKHRTKLMQEYEAYDCEADIYARLDQDLMAEQKKVSRSPRARLGKDTADRDTIIQKLVENLLKEAKLPTGKRDLKYHEEHIILIKLGGLLKTGSLTFVKYSDMKTKHRTQMKAKLMSNEISDYSIDTDLFGRMDKAMMVEIQIILDKEAAIEAEKEKERQRLIDEEKQRELEKQREIERKKEEARKMEEERQIEEESQIEVETHTEVVEEGTETVVVITTLTTTTTVSGQESVQVESVGGQAAVQKRRKSQ